MFFLPDIEESSALKEKIEAYGGKVVEQHECMSYQIRPNTSQKLDFHHFYMGEIYDQTWIDDSIQANYVIGAQDYVYYTNQSESALKLNLGKRKRYTVLEGYTLYTLLGA